MVSSLVSQPPPPGSHLPGYGYHIIGHGSCSLPQFAQVVKMFRMFPRNLMVTSHNPGRRVFPVHASTDTHSWGYPWTQHTLPRRLFHHRVFVRNGETSSKLKLNCGRMRLKTWTRTYIGIDYIHQPNQPRIWIYKSQIQS